MVPNHATQTDPYLHEPKGITTATAGTVYVATGAGTGTWTTPGSSSAFTNSTSSGLFFTVVGGYLRKTSSVTLVNTTTLTLVDATTNYVYLDTTLATIASNVTGFLPSQVPLYTVATSSGVIVTSTDLKGTAVSALPATYGDVPFTSDADITLSAFQYSNSVIRLSGTWPSVGRNIIVPLLQPATFVVNNTAQTLTVKPATGTGIAIATNKTATVCGNGTNVIRLTADV